MESHRKGDLTEAIVITELKRRSIPVSVPFGDNERYDLVLEKPSGDLLRTQVKTGWLAEGKVEFHARSQHTNSKGNTYKSYADDIDCFIVYCHELEACYLIREDEFEESISLRITEPNHENRRINWAEDFEFDTRWPLDSGGRNRTVTQRESVSKVIDKLTDQGIQVAEPVRTNRYQLIIQTSDGRLEWMRVKTGWIDEGCIRYQHEHIPNYFGYLALYVPERDGLYIVPRSHFEASITLRVEEPEKPDSRINWAGEYAFPEHIP